MYVSFPQHFAQYLQAPQDVFQEFSEAQDSNSTDWPLPNSRSPSPEPDLQTIAQYVRDINGQISVSSELGSGTIFNIELPFDHYPEGGKTRKVGFRLSNSQPPSSSPKGPLPSIPPPPRSPVTKNGDNKRWSPPRLDSPTVTVNGNSLLGVDSYTNDSGRSTPNLSNSNGLTQNPVQAGSKLASLHILIAEDDTISTRILDERLTQWGHTVAMACDGQECYDIFAAEIGKVDVILMDLQVCLKFPLRSLLYMEGNVY
jgi:CheY-like chemotaxis protein